MQRQPIILVNEREYYIHVTVTGVYSKKTIVEEYLMHDQTDKHYVLGLKCAVKLAKDLGVNPRHVKVLRYGNKYQRPLTKKEKLLLEPYF